MNIRKRHRANLYIKKSVYTRLKNMLRRQGIPVSVWFENKAREEIQK